MQRTDILKTGGALTPNVSSESEFGAGLRCLVVDDEPSIIAFVEAVLTDSGLHLETAARIEEARAKIAAQSYDLYIVDKNLPDGSGLELLEEVRRDGRDAKVLLMTAYATVEAATQAVSLGVADLVTKPVDPDDLLERVRKIVVALRVERDEKDRLEELAQKTAALEDLAARDSLTHLYNHRYLQEFLESEVQRSGRHRLEFGLILIDVDNFKQINDDQGHLIGDRVLVELAGIFAGHGRSSDIRFRLRENDIAARYGGDEFAIVLPETPKRGASAKAELLREFVGAYDWSGTGCPEITLSLGVAGFPDDAGDRRDMIEAADLALYAAKRSGRNRVLTFTPAMRGVDREAPEVRRVDALRESIATRAFDYVYQPIVRAADSQIIGYEAFVRPQHEQLASPEQLFATAEHAGRIADLGMVLRERAIEPLDELPDGARLFINVHPLELNDRLVRWTEGLGKKAERIVFELCETAKMRDPVLIGRFFETLRATGAQIALDDVPLGYSLLDSLGRLVPDFVKLDLSILERVGSDSAVARLIRHLIEYAYEERLTIIGSGVETESQRDEVVRIGCQLLQGYFFARPASGFQPLS